MRKFHPQLIKVLTVTAAVMIFAGCGTGTASLHSGEITEKLDTNLVLKRGWAELPVPVYISETVPERFRSATVTALEMWNEKAGKEIFVYEGVVASEMRDYDGQNVIYWNEKPHPKGYFGETHLMWVNDTAIIEADIVFHGNPDDFGLLTCGQEKTVCTTAIKKKDLTTTALHEIGHVIGFVHTSEPDNLMNPAFSLGDVHHRFDDDLLSELLSVYNSEIVAKR